MAKISANYEVVYIVDPAIGEEAIAATVETGKVAKAQGARAAYVFVVNNISGEVDPASYSTERIPLTEKAAQMYKNDIYSSFLKKANIKDHRTDMTF